MRESYPATYRDERGEEDTVIHNDGKVLQMTVRGVTFTGSMLDDFEPSEPLDDPSLSTFRFNRYSANAADLSGCTLEFAMPMPVVTPEGMTEASLDVVVELGRPTERGGIDYEEFKLALRLAEGVYASAGTSGWMEDELLEIQRKLPEGTYMRACINCAYSDYSVYGHAAFGCMMCFRGVKSKYLSVRTKADFMRVMGTYTEQVQETYLCPEFERRAPGTGYRG